jgi:hypothetical protein
MRIDGVIERIERLLSQMLTEFCNALRSGCRKRVGIDRGERLKLMPIAV